MATSPVAIKLPRYISAPLNGSTTTGTTYQIQADAVVTERHTDNVEVTDQPVEQGSLVSDHAYRRPSELTLTYYWAMASSTNVGSSQSFLQTLYKAILAVQNSFSLLTVATGKRLYKNMLIKGIDVLTDKDNENILNMTISLKEIIIATTTVVSLQSSSNMSSPQQTAPVLKQGGSSITPGNNFNPSGAPALKGVS
jgi:hypothetical protein